MAHDTLWGYRQYLWIPYFPCGKCGVLPSSPQDVCEHPDPIPGSLADAVEAMRVKVAEKWCDDVELLISKALNAVCGKTMYDWFYIHKTPRDRFLVFAAALGAVEV